MKHRPPDAIARARRLRREMTDAERLMGDLLRIAFPAARFRRQVPLRHYIADFASHAARLVIEVDGGQHSPDLDARRTAMLEGEGYQVLRFWNHDVLGNADGVHAAIERTLHGRHPSQPSPSRGGLGAQ